MPTFNAYPQNFNVVDVPAIQEQAQRLKSQRTQNKLQEFQLQQAQGEAQRQGQMRDVGPGLGAEAGLGPKAQEALGIDPSMLGELLKIPKDKRDQVKAATERLGNLLQAVETAPPVQRPNVYAMVRQQYAASGADMTNVPETYDPAWVQTKLAEAERFMAVLDQAPEPQYSGAPQFDENVGKYYQINPKTGKREYVASPSGMDIEVGPDGTIIRTGISRGGKDDTQRKTKGTIEGKLMANANNLARLDTIRRKYKRKFLEWGPRITARLLSWKSKFGKKLSSEENKFIQEISGFTRDAIENINLYIKEITGAQMSNPEAGRIRLAQPDPGEGVFGGDAPEVFEAKLESAYASVKRAQARYTY